MYLIWAPCPSIGRNELCQPPRRCSGQDRRLEDLLAPLPELVGVVDSGVRGSALSKPTLGEPAAAERVLECALDLAGPEGLQLFFLLQPAPGLLEGHARHRTPHPSLIAEILDLLSGKRPAPPPAGPHPPLKPLSESEIRVLRYLPTNLSTPEIAK
jgi:hypothetical protein